MIPEGISRASARLSPPTGSISSPAFKCYRMIPAGTQAYVPSGPSHSAHYSPISLIPSPFIVPSLSDDARRKRTSTHLARGPSRSARVPGSGPSHSAPLPADLCNVIE